MLLDPLKNAQFREATRLRTACVESGECDVSSPALQALDRLLIKVPEHTWGVAQSWFLPDPENWTNVQFDAARAAAPHFVDDNAKYADYNSTVNSWIEQRTFVTDAPRLVQQAYPALAKSMTTALAALAAVGTAEPPSPKPNMESVQAGAPVQCGDWRIRLGSTGAVTSLVNSAGKGADWASEVHPIGEFLYQTFTSGDFNMFLKDFGARIGDQGIWPEHTPGQYAAYNYSTSDLSCGNFCKQNMSSAQPQHRELTPTMKGAWRGDVSSSGCTLLTKSTLPDEVQKEAGAPEEIVVVLRVEGTTIDWEVYMVNKRPTRLVCVCRIFPPALIFSYHYDVYSW